VEVRLSPHGEVPTISGVFNWEYINLVGQSAGGAVVGCEVSVRHACQMLYVPQVVQESCAEDDVDEWISGTVERCPARHKPSLL